MDDTLSRLERVFRSTFQDDAISITRETTAQDVKGWDSMMHVILIMNVEQAFKVRFSVSEVAAMRNVGRMVEYLDSRPERIRAGT